MKNTLKKKHVNSSQMKITNFHLSNIKYTAMFIPFKENEPHPQQLPPLFSDLKI